MALNFIVWSLLFAYLVYGLVRSVNINRWYSALIALATYVEVYWLILRPVAMQEVFVFFLFFIWALISWFKEQESKRKDLWLAIASGLTFYIYTYLWQIVACTLGTIFLWDLFRKRWVRVKRIFMVGIGAIMIALPSLVYNVYQLRSAYYHETIVRIGLLNTHFPTQYFYLYGRWALILALFTGLTRKWIALQRPFVAEAIMYISIGLLIVSGSNIITGMELETAQHIGRFTTLVVPLGVLFLLHEIWVKRSFIIRLPLWKKSILGFCFLSTFGFMVFNLPRSLIVREIFASDIQGVQAYEAPLFWLEEHEPEPQVIWTDDELGFYVPIVTKHYVLWSQLGKLHLMSSDEVEDRYLLSRMESDPDMLKAYDQINGSGVGHMYELLTYQHTWDCRFNSVCEALPSIKEWIGPTALSTLSVRAKDLQKNIMAELKRFNVTYIVADKAKGEDKYLLPRIHAAKMWENERFVVLKVL